LSSITSVILISSKFYFRLIATFILSRKIFAVLFILFAILPIVIFGQNYGIIRGTVSDSTTSETLAYGNVYIKELSRGTSTDERGNFIFPQIESEKTYTLIVTYVGYATKQVSAYTSKNKITHIDIGLRPGNIELGTVLKTADRVDSDGVVEVSLQRITVKELEKLPRGVEMDIFRSLQFLPGVSSTGDVTSKYYVRGSASHQNLVMINNSTIYNPFHALGMFSIIDPDIINNLDFYKGGFPADYSGRVSSVLNLITKDGNKNNYNLSATTSLLTGKLLAEGPIPNGSFIISGRKTYSDQILKKFLNYKSIPLDFYDLSFKINYLNPDFMEDTKFSVHAFLSGDEINNNNLLREDFKWNNSVVGFNVFRISPESPMYTEMGLSVSNYNGEVIPNYSDSKKRKNELNDITYFLDINYIYSSKDEINAGLRIENIKTKLSIENTNGSMLSLNEHGTNISAFIKYKLLRLSNLGIDFGTRINATGLSNSNLEVFEPRLNITYNVFPNVVLKLAWGIYQQNLVSLSSENDIISLFEPWIIIPNYIDVARSIHYVGGLGIRLGKFSLDFEGYYKFVHNNPILNDKKFFPSDPDLISGKQESFGYETYLTFRDSPINATISYSLSWAYLENAEWLYNPRYDIRHSLNCMVDYNLGSGWMISAVWILNTGMPFTQNMGYYQKLSFDNTWDNYESLLNFAPQSILFGKNLGRLPAYHRLDFSLSKKFNFSFMKMYVDLSVINVYDRKNIFYFERDTGQRVNMLPIIPTATLKIMI
jgi:CarboxypepD_reg-like domain/TonB-dependent Receptor Plug Domain